MTNTDGFTSWLNLVLALAFQHITGSALSSAPAHGSANGALAA